MGGDTYTRSSGDGRANDGNGARNSSHSANSQRSLSSRAACNRLNVYVNARQLVCRAFNSLVRRRSRHGNGTEMQAEEEAALRQRQH